MPAIHIRDIPEEVLAALKRRAAANHRSLQGELLHALTVLAQEAPPRPQKRLKLHFSDVPDNGSTWGRDEIYRDDDL